MYDESRRKEGKNNASRPFNADTPSTRTQTQLMTRSVRFRSESVSGFVGIRTQTTKIYTKVDIKALRTLALPRKVSHWTLTTLREKLIKIGAKVVRHAQYVTFQMAEVAIPRQLFATILDKIAQLRLLPGTGQNGWHAEKLGSRKITG